MSAGCDLEQSTAPYSKTSILVTAVPAAAAPSSITMAMIMMFVMVIAVAVVVVRMVVMVMSMPHSRLLQLAEQLSHLGELFLHLVIVEVLRGTRVPGCEKTVTKTLGSQAVGRQQLRHSGPRLWEDSS